MKITELMKELQEKLDSLGDVPVMLYADMDYVSCRLPAEAVSGEKFDDGTVYVLITD